MDEAGVLKIYPIQLSADKPRAAELVDYYHFFDRGHTPDPERDLRPPGVWLVPSEASGRLGIEPWEEVARGELPRMLLGQNPSGERLRAPSTGRTRLVQSLRFDLYLPPALAPLLAAPGRHRVGIEQTAFEAAEVALQHMMGEISVYVRSQANTQEQVEHRVVAAAVLHVNRNGGTTRVFVRGAIVGLWLPDLGTRGILIGPPDVSKFSRTVVGRAAKLAATYLQSRLPELGGRLGTARSGSRSDDHVIHGADHAETQRSGRDVGLGWRQETSTRPRVHAGERSGARVCDQVAGEAGSAAPVSTVSPARLVDEAIVARIGWTKAAELEAEAIEHAQQLSHMVRADLEKALRAIGDPIDKIDSDVARAARRHERELNAALARRRVWKPQVDRSTSGHLTLPFECPQEGLTHGLLALEEEIEALRRAAAELQQSPGHPDRHWAGAVRKVALEIVLGKRSVEIQCAEPNRTSQRPRTAPRQGREPVIGHQPELDLDFGM